MTQRRRGRGEGSIYQRPDGRWCAMIDLGFINGKRKRKYVYGATRKDVVAKLKAAHQAQAAGVNLAAERITLAAFLDRWLAEVVSKRNKIRTIDGYTQIVQDHLKPHLGQYQLDKLLPEHVQAMLNRLAEEGRKYHTVRNIRAVLQRALNQAMRWQYVSRNVATLVDVPRYVHTDPADPARGQNQDFTIQPLDEQQARRLLHAVAGHRLEAIYRVALSLGLRAGEVLGLRWSDIDVTRASLRITGAIQRLRGKLVRTTTKTSASARAIDIPPVLLGQLKRRQTLQAQERLDAGERWREHDLVFTTTNGTPIDPRNLTRHFKRVLQQAGLPHTIRFHDLRHSCATLLIAQGVHPRVVMEILRHTQISTTMNTYAHVLPRLQRDATTKIEELFAEPPAEDAPTEEEAPENEGASDRSEATETDAAEAITDAPHDTPAGTAPDSGGSTS
jgi:integrase